MVNNENNNVLSNGNGKESKSSLSVPNDSNGSHPSTEYSTKKEKIPDVPWYKSCRILMAFISAWGYVFFYVLRIDLSMAIVCMVKDPNTTNLLQSVDFIRNASDFETTDSGKIFITTGNPFLNDSELRILGFLNTTSATISGKCSGSSFAAKKYTGELEWSKSLRGYVLSSFFYGYIVTQVPGGWLAGRYGGKAVFGYGVLVTVAATLLVPIAARTHAYLLIVLRVIMGLGCGVGFPATHNLYGKWIPPNERSRLVSFSHAGTYVGTIIALVLSGILCNLELDNGWPLIFYVYGIMTFVWWLFWQFLVYSSPDEHPRIDPIEKNYIIKSIGKSAEKNTEKNAPIPWLQILKSPPVWAIIVAHSCNNWSNYTILICIPMYMQEVLRFDIKQNGAWSSLPYISSYLSAILCGHAADFLITRHILSIRATRKFMQCLSATVPALLILLMGFMDCDMRYLAVALLCVTLGINSSCRSGFMINHIDLSPRHAGILFGISNTVATIPGMIAPTVVGILTPKGTREEWLKVFIICAALYLFSAVIYGVFADGQEQSWANPSHNSTNAVDVKVENGWKETIQRNGGKDEISDEKTSRF